MCPEKILILLIIKKRFSTQESLVITIFIERNS